MRLKYCSFEFVIWASLKAICLFFVNIKNSFFQKAENPNVEDGTHQISFKINEKCWGNVKLSNPVIA
jgi:uncharacterized protein YccT (UPF0319 family)